MKIIHSVKFIESIWHFPWDCVRIKNSCKSWKRKDKGMKAGICYIVGAGENYGLEIRPNEDDGFLTLVNRIIWQKPHNCGFFMSSL